MTSAPNEMILASAGTGKTFALSSRYLRLLIDGESPSSILATTFTRKAAGEILDRIIQRLADGALDELQALELASQLQRPGCTSLMFAELLSSLTAQLNNIQVQTLDAFFAQLARSFSLDLGLPPDWEISDETEMQRLQDYAIRISLAERSSLAIVHDLSKGEARRGISPMVRTMIGDLYHIYRETADTNRLAAWDVLTERPILKDEEIDQLETRLQEVAANSRGGVVKALAQHVVDVATRDWVNLLAKGIGLKISQQETTFSRKPIPDEIVAALSPFVDHAIAIQINMLVRQTDAAKRMLEIFHRRFDRLKHDEATLRFDDVNYLASQLLNNYSAGQFAFRLDRQIEHLMLDEFQDTSIEQWKVLRPIAKRACSTGPNRSFFCVGDVKQAIYGWRGGVAEIFDDVMAEFGNSLEQPSHLNKSFRSSPVIIEMVNETFTNMAALPQLDDRRPPYQTWCDKFKAHDTERVKLPGYATLETSDADRHLQFTAERIRDLSQQHPGKTIGVLARTNKQIAELIFELGLLGVRASEEGGNPLTDSAAVNLVLSGLRLVDHPDDSASRFHILHSPLAEVFELTPENWTMPESPCRDAAQRIRGQLLDSGYGPVMGEWSRVMSRHCTAREWFRLNQLVEHGYRVSVADHSRSADLIAYIEKTQVPDPSAAPVRVMTVHKSKGLEFDVVVLPFMNFYTGSSPAYLVGRDSPTGPIQVVCHHMDSVKLGWMPDSVQRAFQRNLESRTHEMLSVMYVSMTRAKHALHVIAEHKASPTHKSALGLVMGALKVVYNSKQSEASQVLWSRGDPDWSKHIEVNADKNEAIEQAGVTRMTSGSAMPQLVRFATAKTKRALAWESPSSREGGNQVHLDRLLRLENNRDARLAGTLLHACFDQIKWIDDWTTDEQVLHERLMGVAGADPGTVQNALAEFNSFLKQPELSGWLSRSAYAMRTAGSGWELSVENERRFAVRIDDRILNGTIDRLITFSNDGIVQSADIVDFKTDDLGGGDSRGVSLRTEIYRPQMNAYRDAVSRIYRLPLDQVTARLIFVAIDQQVEIV